MEGEALHFFSLKGGANDEEDSKSKSKGAEFQGDSDSGLDNHSDSGSNSDEEPSRTSSSDSDDSFARKAAVLPKQPGFDKISCTTCKVSLCSDDPKKSNESPVPDKENDVNLKNLPEFFRELVKGQLESIDFSVTLDSRPDWLDCEKFKLGQKFATENLFSLNFAEMLSLIMLFALDSALKPLIFTGRSDTPFKAFRRYLNTVTKLKSWYQGDLWCEEDTEAKRNLRSVKAMHKNVYTRLTESTREELDVKTSLGDPSTIALWCPLKDMLKEDFRSSCPVVDFNPYHLSEKVWVNQLDMSITQFGFVGLVVTYPSYFGLHSTKEEELDAFLHMWRGLGYLLGIKDKYNFCNANLETVRQRTKDFIQMAVKPSFREVTEDWEHMSRCMTRGIAFYIPFVEFESALMYLCYTIEIDMPRLKKAMTFKQYLRFQAHKFVNLLQRIPGVLPAMNRRLNGFIKAAQEASPEVLARWQATEFDYTKQPGKRQISC